MTDPKRIAKGMYWDRAWHLVSGCTPVSPGCDHCWAAREAHMRAGQSNEKIKGKYEGLTTEDGRWNGQIRLLHENMELPLKRKKPTVWAIWNDLFHPLVPDMFIINALSIMAEASQHTFLLLTKRPERMKEIITHDTIAADVWLQTTTGVDASPLEWPLPNVWLGVTAENQEQADKRIPILLQIPAVVRFVSVEPMFGPVDLGKANGLPVFKWADKVITTTECKSGKVIGCFQGGFWQKHDGNMQPWLNWVICGGESGPGARPMHPDWARGLRDQCQVAGTQFFFKQWGEYIVPEDGAESCRVCGCTWNNACEGGCYWVEPGLCSNCVGKEVPPYRAVKYQRVDKKKAGRLLDGREHNEMPVVSR